MVIELAINSQADNDTGLTYGQIIESDGINAGQVIPYGPDMYRQALPIILKHGYAVASDPDGKNSKICNNSVNICILRLRKSRACPSGGGAKGRCRTKK